MILDIIYATQTGNAETISKKLQSIAKEQGFIVTLNEMNYHNIDSFKQLKNVAIITSTYGNGEVPDMGVDFWNELKAYNNKISNLYYGLIALGDRSHEIFCGAGRSISKKLEELDCKKVIEDLECDGDTEGSYEWSIKFLDRLKSRN
tara:strand:+ start:140 stop:580 length:441 start_codon:yes stop_codon:yes gene_type:complete